MVQRRLNLGCGRDYKAGWDNWDRGDTKCDLKIDITAEEWPVPDNYYNQIYCSGVLEQIEKNEDFVFVLNECWRVLKKKGSLTIIVPSARYSNAFKDPFDVRFFTLETFDYINSEENEYKLYGQVYGFKPWVIRSQFRNNNGIINIVLQKNET